jgi:hypothetical protein
MEVSSQMGPFSIVPEWVLDRGLSPTALKLYIVMARFADWNTGIAFPSRETLAKRMKCSVKTVDRAVIEIVAAECVSKISRGRYASALYQVYQVDPRGTDLTSEWTDMSSEGTDLSSRLDKNDHITITNKQEPLEREPVNDKSEQFNVWWSSFPRKEGKGAARKEFDKALKKVGLDKLVEAAENYRNDPNREPKFTVQPARWLREERWDDSPLPLNRKMTNSEHNIQNFRASLALLAEQPMKEVENEQVRNKGAIDFGVNFRSADSV